MQQIHAHHLRAETEDKRHACAGGDHYRTTKAFPGFAGTDPGNHFVAPDERAHYIRSHIAELGNENKVEQEKLARIRRTARRKREKADLLNKVQQPGHIHQAKQRRGNGGKPGRILFGNKLSHAQAEDKQDQKTGFKIIYARRRTGRAEPTGHVQESSHHQKQAADDTGYFEIHHPALFGDPIKFHQTGQCQERDDQQKHSVRNQTMAGKQGGQDNRPQKDGRK